MLPNRPAFFLLLTAFAAPALAAAAQPVVVPSGSLADALTAIARQANIDIGGSDPLLARATVRGFTTKAPPAVVLNRLLAGTGFRALPLPGGAFRIVRAPIVAHTGPPVRRKPEAVLPEASAGGDIVVLASKRDRLLIDYPGGTVLVKSSDDAFGPIGAGGTDWLLNRTPVLQSTQLGSGRNKLFIRGIADSSFAGPTQSTVSTYFGGVRTGYSGPDPNLNLYDIDEVEILEGPQGTLYGAGSIGGIIQLTPKAPVLDRAAASAEIGSTAIQHGGLGYDSAAMINYAPWEDRLAIRAVGYRSRNGGYIDIKNGPSNVNSLTQTGGRIAIRARPIDGMTIDASYILQNSKQPDLQYSQPSVGALARAEAVDQPFSDGFRMARFVAEQRFAGGWTVGATVGRVNHDTEQRYDAIRPDPIVGGPQVYDESVDIALTTVEAHVSQALRRGGGWLIGFSDIWDTTAAGRTVGSLAAPRDLIGVSNRTQERAGYGEGTLPIGRSLKVTVGVRYTSARMDGEPSRTPSNRDFIKGQTTKRFDPELGLTYHLMPQLQWFAEYTQGFRTGGLAVARGAGRVATYEADHVDVAQSGLRLFRRGPTGVAGYVAVSYARWGDIQADLIGPSGFPYTANVGDGRILTLEASADYAPVADLSIKGALVLNRSRLIDALPEYVTSAKRPLPASPGVTATASAVWAHKFGASALRTDIHARYVGKSRLGVGPTLDIPYGNFVETGATAALAFGRYEASLGIENLLDTQGNRFAIGNPFAISLRNEATPLQPRTVRLGLKVSY